MQPRIYPSDGMKKTAPPPSFDDWFERLRPQLLRLAYSRLEDWSEAEDVVQESALALWKRLDKGDIEEPEAYAARAVWQNALRRRSRRKDWVALEEAEEASVEAEIDTWVESLAMEDALAQLPPAQQAVVRLRYYTGLTLKETAATLAIGLNTAASRCRYALDALRGQHSEEEDHGKGNGSSSTRPARGRQLRARRPSGHRGRP